MIDALRVFVLRIMKRRSPFSADRKHIHHQLMDLGLDQKQVAGLLYAVNMLFIVSAWLFRFLEPTMLFYTFIISALALVLLPATLIYLRK